jgi:hypothetical protein
MNVPKTAKTVMIHMDVRQAFRAICFISLGFIPSAVETKNDAAEIGFVMTMRAGNAIPT